MSTNGWGKGSVNNTNGWGAGAFNNTISWGDSHFKSWSGNTDIDGSIYEIIYRITEDDNQRITEDSKKRIIE